MSKKRNFKPKSGWVCACGQDKVFKAGLVVNFGRTAIPSIEFNRVIFTTKSSLIDYGSNVEGKCYYCKKRVNPVKIEILVVEVKRKKRIQSLQEFAKGREEGIYEGAHIDCPEHDAQCSDVQEANASI